MIRILHGSDIHFGKPHVPRVADALQEAARTLDPDIIVLSGDFTQRAKIREYEEARRFLDALPDIPRVVTPGNHDVPLYRGWERALSPLRNYKRYIHPDLDVVTRIEGATFVSLNSAAPYTAIVNGRVLARQVAFAREAFAASPRGDLRFVVVHHALVPAPDGEDDRPLAGAGRVVDALADMEVEMVLSGHLHRGFVASSRDVRPHGPHREFLIVHSGTTTSNRGRVREAGRQSLNLVLIDDTAIQVHHYSYVESAGGFVPDIVHAYPRGAASYFSADAALDAVPSSTSDVR